MTPHYRAAVTALATLTSPPLLYYSGALADIREGFRILRPGGYLLGHDAYPEDKPSYHGGMGWNGVTRALREFCAEHGWTRAGAAQDGYCANPWALVVSSGYIFALHKGTGPAAN